MSTPEQAASGFPVTKVEKQLYVDVCTDKDVAYETASYRVKQGGTLLTIYSVPEAEVRYVTAVASGTAPAPSGPTGQTLPLPIVAAWIVVSVHS